MVSVLIDHDVVVVHIAWLADCDFNVPKASARVQALESKTSIGRYLEAVPLTVDERAIVECDLE